MRSKRIGLDLDNTIIDYSNAAKKYAESIGLENIEDLASLRNALRGISDWKWQEAQAWIYSSGMDFAAPSHGWSHFLNSVSKFDWELFIVSHKTRFSAIVFGSPDLHISATRWLESRLKVREISQLKGIYFESSRQAKIERISHLNLNMFVDDLPEVLNDSNFPENVKAILYDPNNNYESSEIYSRIGSLCEVCLHE